MGGRKTCKTRKGKGDDRRIGAASEKSCPGIERSGCWSVTPCRLCIIEPGKPTGDAVPGGGGLLLAGEKDFAGQERPEAREQRPREHGERVAETRVRKKGEDKDISIGYRKSHFAGYIRIL